MCHMYFVLVLEDEEEANVSHLTRSCAGILRVNRGVACSPFFLWRTRTRTRKKQMCHMLPILVLEAEGRQICHMLHVLVVEDEKEEDAREGE